MHTCANNRRTKVAQLFNYLIGKFDWSNDNFDNYLNLVLNFVYVLFNRLSRGCILYYLNYTPNTMSCSVDKL